MVKKIKASRLLSKTQEAFKNNTIVLHEGGSRSTKTWSIFQHYIFKALKGEGFTLTIVRDKLTWIKTTLLKDFEEIVELFEIPVYPEINPRRPEQEYSINGSEFAFFGLDYADKLHGRKQDYFWVNEAMEVSKKEFDQIEMRTSIGGVLDYNPYNDDHFVFDLVKRNDVTKIKSTYRDNPFLPDKIIKKIESYEPTAENIKQGTADQYMWTVYGLGEKAKLEGLVFENYNVVDAFPEGSKLLGYGLDFGYTNDETALIEVRYFDKGIFLKELIYSKKLLNKDIDRIMKNLKIEGKIYADSAEPKSIEELSRKGWDIQGATKGADSIRYGIDLMKQYGINIIEGSINLDNEFRKYRWAEDRQGNRLQNPVDAFNHGIDGVRYCVMETLGSEVKITTVPHWQLGL